MADDGVAGRRKEGAGDDERPFRMVSGAIACIAVQWIEIELPMLLCLTEDEQPEKLMDLNINIVSARGLPEGSSTVVKYKYSMIVAENQKEEDIAAAAEDGEGEQGMGLIEGKTAEFEEPVEGTEHTYNLTESYPLPAVTDSMLYRLITVPMHFKVDGLGEVPGKVMVPLRALVWKSHDPEDLEPDDPSLVVTGWYPIVPDAPLEEGQTFPESAEILIRLHIPRPLLPEDELRDLNVLTVNVHSMHRLPALWGPTPEKQGEHHDYIYTLRYTLPGEAGSSIETKVDSGQIVAKQFRDPDMEPGSGAEVDHESDSGGRATAQNTPHHPDEGEGACGAVQSMSSFPSLRTTSLFVCWTWTPNWTPNWTLYLFKPLNKVPGQEHFVEIGYNCNARASNYMYQMIPCEGGAEGLRVQRTESKVEAVEEETDARIQFAHSEARAMQVGLNHINPEPWTLNPGPCTLDPKPLTQIPKPYTLRRAMQVCLNPQPRTRIPNPDIQTLDPKPQSWIQTLILNPEAWTPNHEP
jgi:hypothetical protein